MTGYANTGYAAAGYSAAVTDSGSYVNAGYFAAGYAVDLSPNTLAGSNVLDGILVLGRPVMVLVDRR